MSFFFRQLGAPKASNYCLKNRALGFPGIQIAKQKRWFNSWPFYHSIVGGSPLQTFEVRGHVNSASQKGHVSAEIARNFLCFPGRVTHFPRRFPFWIPKTLKSDLPIRKRIIFQLPSTIFQFNSRGLWPPIRWRTAGGPYGWSPCLRGGGWHLCGQGGLRRTTSGAAERLEEACD